MNILPFDFIRNDFWISDNVTQLERVKELLIMSPIAGGRYEANALTEETAMLMVQAGNLEYDVWKKFLDLKPDGVGLEAFHEAYIRGIPCINESLLSAAETKKFQDEVNAMSKASACYSLIGLFYSTRQEHFDLSHVVDETIWDVYKEAMPHEHCNTCPYCHFDGDKDAWMFALEERLRDCFSNVDRDVKELGEILSRWSKITVQLYAPVGLHYYVGRCWDRIRPIVGNVVCEEPDCFWCKFGMEKGMRLQDSGAASNARNN